MLDGMQRQTVHALQFYLIMMPLAQPDWHCTATLIDLRLVSQ